MLRRCATIATRILLAFSLLSWRFKALLALLFLVGLWLLYLRRVRREIAKVQARLYARFAERERMARDLHDSFFQGIQGLLLSIQSACRRLPEGDPTRSALEGALAQSDGVMLQGRALVSNLRVRPRHAHDLAVQLEAAANEFAHHPAPEFRLVVRGQPRDLNPHVCEELYQLGREALDNAYRHAHARLIEAAIDYRPDNLRLAVSDDGVGIDSKILSGSGVENHRGMQRMEERAARIGAAYRVLSSPGSGTIVQAYIASRLAYPSRARAEWRRFLDLFRTKDLED
ncbi:Histidine kinase-, DNA gyrase B-, and HSP90-like ATPase [Granulicella rosea]|uniref:Histidine kinase-, DNA gyrase B-, and HSP90-like ATPase n=1 Tax=Granulicella rosea TaxID=474952 RepID=A0A239JWU0_9BACT|nr:histidine kinase [Granulicella rosea]SNT09938.1 Histidine kinase-, DNA gyrase B-, and HSP90-like ATPase [Granulicella rosea]